MPRMRFRLPGAHGYMLASEVAADVREHGLAMSAMWSREFAFRPDLSVPARAAAYLDLRESVMADLSGVKG